jgi:hypothetical protein
LVSGFWHGASWNFIAWGFIHACGFLPLLLLNRNRRYTTDVVAQDRALPTLKELFQMLSTFTFVTIAWVFFRAETLGDAVGYIYNIVKDLSPYDGGYKKEFLLIIIFVIIDYSIRKDSRIIKFNRSNLIINILWYSFLIISIVEFYKWNQDTSTFIYFEF